MLRAGGSELAELCDILTVEIEHVNCEILSSLETRGVKVQPSPRTISVVQDKYAQKEHFEEVSDPTSFGVLLSLSRALSLPLSL